MGYDELLVACRPVRPDDHPAEWLRIYRRVEQQTGLQPLIYSGSSTVRAWTAASTARSAPANRNPSSKQPWPSSEQPPCACPAPSSAPLTRTTRSATSGTRS